MPIVTWRAMRVRSTSCASPAAMRSASACGGVARDVQHRLDQLLAVAAELGDARCRSRAPRLRPRGNSARISERTRSQTSWMLTSPTTCGRRCGASRRSTSACRRSASCDDDLGVLGAARAPSSSMRQQLRRAADAAERVLDLVREVAHQLLVGLRLAERALLAVLPRLLLDLDHLDQHALGQVVGLVDDHVHRQRSRDALPAGGAAAAVEAAGGEVVAGHGGQRSRAAWRGSTNQSAACGARRRGAARPSRFSKRGVGEQAVRRRACDHRHHRGQQVEAPRGRSAAALASRRRHAFTTPAAWPARA